MLQLEGLAAVHIMKHAPSGALLLDSLQKRIEQVGGTCPPCASVIVRVQCPWELCL